MALENQITMSGTFEMYDTDGGVKQRPFQNGQVITLIAYISGADKRTTKSGDEVKFEKSGLLCLDGRLLADYLMVGDRYLGEDDHRSTPFDEGVFSTLPAGMQRALTRCETAGSNNQLYRQMFKNLLNGNEWVPNFKHPVPVKVRLRTQRHSGTHGISRWYWFESAELLPVPPITDIDITDEDKNAFIRRFSLAMSNAADFWESLPDDSKKVYIALMR